MTAASVTIHNFPSDGSYIARGVATSLSDGYTIDTGLITVEGITMTSNTADTVCSFTSQSAGVVTVAAKTAGSAASGVTVYWVAWLRPHKG